MSPNYTNKQSAYRIGRVKNKPRPVPLVSSQERERKKDRDAEREREREIGAKTQEENLQDSFIDNRGRFLVARL